MKLLFAVCIVFFIKSVVADIIQSSNSTENVKPIKKLRAFVSSEKAVPVIENAKLEASSFLNDYNGNPVDYPHFPNEPAQPQNIYHNPDKWIFPLNTRIPENDAFDDGYMNSDRLMPAVDQPFWQNHPIPFDETVPQDFDSTHTAGHNVIDNWDERTASPYWNQQHPARLPIPENENVVWAIPEETSSETEAPSYGSNNNDFSRYWNTEQTRPGNQKTQAPSYGSNNNDFSPYWNTEQTRPGNHKTQAPSYGSNNNDFSYGKQTRPVQSFKDNHIIWNFPDHNIPELTAKQPLKGANNFQYNDAYNKRNPVNLKLGNRPNLPRKNQPSPYGSNNEYFSRYWDSKQSSGVAGIKGNQATWTYPTETIPEVFVKQPFKGAGKPVHYGAYNHTNPVSLKQGNRTQLQYANHNNNSTKTMVGNFNMSQNGIEEERQHFKTNSFKNVNNKTSSVKGIYKQSQNGYNIKSKKIEWMFPAYDDYRKDHQDQLSTKTHYAPAEERYDEHFARPIKGGRQLFAKQPQWPSSDSTIYIDYPGKGRNPWDITPQQQQMSSPVSTINGDFPTKGRNHWDIRQEQQQMRPFDSNPYAYNEANVPNNWPQERPPVDPRYPYAPLYNHVAQQPWSNSKNAFPNNWKNPYGSYSTGQTNPTIRNYNGFPAPPSNAYYSRPSYGTDGSYYPY